MLSGIVVWLVGRSSRLGAALEALLDRKKYGLIATDLEDVDITNLRDVTRFADRTRPDIIINCAGRTDRAWCEQQPEEAYALHAIGARNLAIVAQQMNIHLIYLSTDFVFDGKSETPYTEFDPLCPTTVFGKSKAAGEEFVRRLCNKYTILRSSWMYGKKHLKAWLREARETGKVRVGRPIIGSPTSSLELAEAVLQFLDEWEYGIFHISSEGECTQRAFIRELLETAQIPFEFEEDESENGFDYLRPHYSVLDNYMLRLTKKKSMRDWKEGLHRFITERHILR